jgi:hypothetical protein
MYDLFNPNQKLVIFDVQKDVDYKENGFKQEQLYSVLYPKDWTILPIKKFFENELTDTYGCIATDIDNNTFREQILKILEYLKIESGIIKYQGTNEFVKISSNGEEIKLNLMIYESESPSPKYIYDGISFSFKEKTVYFYPRKKEHLKIGMVVEYYNDSVWTSKEISDLDSEYEKLYKLLIKYNKLRTIQH